MQKKKLLMQKTKVLAITGSYAKTSCKKILNFLLKDFFCIAVTPENYNTPMGLAITIDKMKGNEDLLIAEFGARKEGDIRELCDLFCPFYGILTGVCAQHLETFGTLDAVYREKKELANAVDHNAGIMVFNANDKNTFRMWKQYGGKKLSAGTGKICDVFAKEINIKNYRSYFTLCIGDRAWKCSTGLLGRNQIQNIALCVAMCIALGCDVEKIVEKIEYIPNIPHRMEYIYANGVHIIDDSYNANIIGVKGAAEVMTSLPGRKCAVLQGIVEGGEENDELNEGVGETFARVLDLAIVCGVNADRIEKGLNKGGYSGEIIKVKTFEKVKEIIKTNIHIGDNLLFQNDIPDIYS